MPRASGLITPGRRWALPLLLCSRQAAASGGVHPLDRIRMQKAVFLLTRRGASAWRDLYPYKPYDWGPYSRELVDDLDLLTRQGFVRVSQATGSKYGPYVLTEQGQAVVDAAWAHLQNEEQAFLTEVRAYVTSKDFNGLLREVYAEYPEYATESIWSGR
jgi:uncharacterized protein YwgA